MGMEIFCAVRWDLDWEVVKKPPVFICVFVYM